MTVTSLILRGKAARAPDSSHSGPVSTGVNLISMFYQFHISFKQPITTKIQPTNNPVMFPTVTNEEKIDEYVT